MPSNHAPIEPEHREAAKMLEQESDRGCVIFGASLLEDELESLLRAYCRKDQNLVKKVVDPLFQVYAPLSTFSAKIQVSYALGLISERLYKGLELIRKIRNDFAHDRTVVSFQSPKYQERFRAIVDHFRSLERRPQIDEYLARLDDDDDGKRRLIGRGTERQLIDSFAFCLCTFSAKARIGVARDFVSLRRTPISDEL